jgi:peptidoglycan/xylan/chitin deacetylase (PgdA/CDA1 family)
VRHSAIILHGIGTPGRLLEPGEEVFWLSRDRFCHALDRIAGMGAQAPRITFDDGNASDVAIALPDLQARGLSATFFLLSTRLGQPGSLTEADVTRLAEAGQTIGLHGADHVDWRRLDGAGRRREFQTARDRLAALSGQPVDAAAAPFGFYDRQVVHDLRGLGFRCLHTSDRGPARDRDFIRPRNCLEGTMDDAALDAALRGHVPPLRALRRSLGVARKRLLPLRLRP